MTLWASGRFPWTRSFLPRWGGAPGPKVTLDAKAAAKVAALEAQRAEQVNRVLVHPKSDESLVLAARCRLEGEADPVGAAVLYEIATSARDKPTSAHADLWVREHGLEFALRAVVAWAGLTVNWRSLTYVDREYVPVEGWIGPKDEIDRRGYGNTGAVTRLRAVLAASDEETYRAAVKTLGTLRDGERQRTVTAFLAPTETEWVDQACVEVPEGDKTSFLVWCSLGTAEQAETMNERFRFGWNEVTKTLLGTLADGLGPHCVPVLRANLVGWTDADRSRALLDVLAKIPSDEAFTTILEGREQRLYRNALVEAMNEFPERAVRLMGPLLATDPELAPILRAHLLAHPELLEAGLPPEVAELTAGMERLPDAAPEDLPPILAAPPWTGPRPEKPSAVDLSPVDDRQVVWLDGEREEWAARRHYSMRFSKALDGPPSRKALTKGSTDWEIVRYFAEAPLEEARPLLVLWETGELWDAPDCLGPIAARFELDCLPQLMAAARRNPGGHGSLLLPFASLETARLMADWLVRLKSARKTALEWFRRHGVRHLVPDALGRPGKLRDAAEAALRAVPDRVLQDAHGHGPEAVALVEKLVSADPAENLPKTIPTVGSWANPAQLPQITLKTGERALPVEAAGHVLTMLALSRAGEPYAGLDAVLETCDEESLEAFGWAVFEAWRLVGEPAKESWALTGLGVLGRDETVRRLTPIIRAWPGQGGHARAVTGLDVLAQIGTEVALMHLHGIGQRVQFKALKERAREKIDEVAESLGLTSEQLADRLVPDLGLDADGSTVLDYGPRRFTVGFDEQLRPYVIDGAGKRRKDLPAPAAKDDPELAPAAKKAFSALKKDVRSVASVQLLRLEQALVTGRSWPVEEFTELLVGHPLLRHLVRRLVWTCEAGEFRIAEDRTFADVNDDPFDLPPGATVRLAHPALMDGDALSAWGELFADYEIIQPFPQLGRPVHPLPPDGFASFTGRTVPVGRILGLTRRGWLRGTPQDAGVEPICYRPLPDGSYLTIDLDPGIAVGMVDELGDQRLDAIRITPVRDDSWGSWSRDEVLPPTGLDEVTVSEILADLHSLTAEGGGA